MRLGPPRGRGGARPVLEGLHPRHRARLPEADDRAARAFIEPTFRALCDGARFVDDRLAEIFDELRPDVVVEDNVVCFPASRGRGPVGADRLLQPARDADPALPPVFSGLPGGRRVRLGGVPREYPRATRDFHAEFSAFCERARRPALPDGAFIPSRRRSTSTSIPAEVDYARERPLRLDVASARLLRPPSDGGFELPESSPNGEGALVYLSLGSLGSADVDLMRRLVEVLSRVAAPVHRLERARSTTSSSWPTNMWGAGVPAAARDPAARRPRDHPRGQQHDDRVPPLREADDRAAALLGSVRQRPARRRDRVGVRLATVHVRARGAARRDRPAARRHAAARAARCDESEDPGRRREDAGGRSDRAGGLRRRPLTRPRPRRRLAPTMNCSPTAAPLSR